MRIPPISKTERLSLQAVLGMTNPDTIAKLPITNMVNQVRDTILSSTFVR